MRILLACQPVRSHFHSMMPVALAARRLGHALAFASGAHFETLVRGLGFDFLACGVDFDWTQDPLPSVPGYPIPENAPLPARQLIGFTNLAPYFARDLLAHLPLWKPDVIVREPVEFGSPLAAEVFGIPCAAVMWALYINPRFLMNEAYAAAAASFGLDGEAFVANIDRALVIKYLPPAWQMPIPPDPPTAVSFCAPPFDRFREEPAPDWLATLPARPTLYVTLGLSFSQAPSLFRLILDAVDGLDINTIVTTGTELDPAVLGTVPANVSIARYIPAGYLLPHCQAILFHGGFNTLHGAIWHGLPMIVAPLEAGDQSPTAELIAGMGLGLQLSMPTPGMEQIRGAIQSVLFRSEYAAAVRGLQTQMLAAPPVEDAIARLERLAAV